MSPSQGFMKRFYQVVMGQFWDIESIFEIEVSMFIYPVLFVGSWEPRFSSFIVHSSKGFADNRV